MNTTILTCWCISQIMSSYLSCTLTWKWLLHNSANLSNVPPLCGAKLITVPWNCKVWFLFDMKILCFVFSRKSWQVKHTLKFQHALKKLVEKYALFVYRKNIIAASRVRTCAGWPHWISSPTPQPLGHHSLQYSTLIIKY